MNAECYECKKVISKDKSFEVYSKIMCSTQCCKKYRDRIEDAKPKFNTPNFYKPDALCQTF